MKYQTAILILILSLLNISCTSKNIRSRQPSSIRENCTAGIRQLFKGKKKSLGPEELKRAAKEVQKLKPRRLIELGGRVKLVSDAQKSLAIKVMAIRKAKHTIDLSTYIFKNDETGYVILNELKKATQRGVKIRFLVDSVGSLSGGPLHNELKALMAANPDKVDVVVFNAINPIHRLKQARLRIVDFLKRIYKRDYRPEETLLNIDRRSHDKMLLVDARDNDRAIAIFGGRNLSNTDTNIDGSVTPNTDIEFVIRNIPGGQDKNEQSFAELALEYYEKLFYNVNNQNMMDATFNIYSADISSQVMRMHDASTFTDDLSQPVARIINDLEQEEFFENNFSNSNLAFLNELINAKRRRPVLSPYYGLFKLRKLFSVSIERNIFNSMRRSKKSIKIVSPYLHFTNREIKFLHRWLMKDKSRTIKIVTNSVLTSDNILPQAHFDEYVVKKLLKNPELNNQIEIYQYGKLDSDQLGGDTQYGLMHSKYYVFDDDSLIMGSSNLDARSRFYNTEVGVRLTDVEGQAIDEINQDFASLVNSSHRWGGQEWKEIHEHPDTSYPNLLKRAIHRLLQALVYTMPNYRLH